MLVINESFVDLTKGERYADSGWHDPYFGEAADDIGALYRGLRSEHGRCTGHVYVDTTGGDVVAVGWVFVKRVQGERSNGHYSYTQETWVSVGERDDDGKVWRFDVKRRKGSMPVDPRSTFAS